MAAGILPAPGTELGPCKTMCSHTDCLETRRMAGTSCTICGEVIGYDRRFYDSRRHNSLTHALCLEEEFEV